MAIRLLDVALHSGVSEATASRVLNQRPDVSATTRERVVAAAEELGYLNRRKPGDTAGELVGVITRSGVSGDVPGLVDGVVAALHRRHHLPVLCSQVHGAPPEGQAVERLLVQGVDRFVFVSGDHTDATASHELYHSLSKSGKPCVLVGGAAFATRLARISLDERGGVSMAMRHLSQLGHSRIGMITGPAPFLSTRRKLEAFLSDCAAKGFPSKEAEALVKFCFNAEEAGRRAACELLDNDCTALICEGGATTLGVLRVAVSRGLDIPGGLSVVSYGDSPEARYGGAVATVVRAPVEKMAEAAVDALLMSVKGTPLLSVELFFAPDLLIRETTGQAPSF